MNDLVSWFGSVPRRFIIIGDVMADIVAQVGSSPVRGTDVAASIRMHGGGAAANTAAWLASRGCDVTLIARVGNDDLGRSAQRRLSSLGVTTSFAVDTHEPTGSCIVIVESDGERTMLPDAGANDRLAATDLVDAAFSEGAHLHLSGYSLLKSGSRMAALSALDLARRRHMTISVDAASAGPLSNVGPSEFRRWTSGVDLCFANEDEAALLSGRSNPDEAVEELLHEGDHRYVGVVIKRGSEGALGAYREERVHSPAIGVEVVDSTGAGDAFAAGFLAGLSRGRSFSECLAEANVLGGRAVTGVGAQP